MCGGEEVGSGVTDDVVTLVQVTEVLSVEGGPGGDEVRAGA